MAPSDKKKIDSLQALRALACFCIFLAHCQFPNVVTWAVTVFFMLSGFVMTRSALAKPTAASPTLKSAFCYAYGKISKLYPLHILTMLPFLLLEILRLRGALDFQALCGLVKSLAVSLLLLISWIPDTQNIYSFNGVAWYLSTMTFIYFIFPFLVHRFHLRRDRKTALAALLLLTALEFALALGYRPLSAVLSVLPFFPAEEAFITWFFYTFPPFRALDFIIGCQLAVLLEGKESELSQSKAWLIDIACLVLFLGGIAVFRGNSFLSTTAFRRGVIFVPFSIVAISSFALDRGLAPRIFTNRATVFFGNISAPFFLIHQVFIEYLYIFMDRFFQYSFFVDLAVVSVLSLIMSIIASVLWQNWTEHRRHKRT